MNYKRDEMDLSPAHATLVVATGDYLNYLPKEKDIVQIMPAVGWRAVWLLEPGDEGSDEVTLSDGRKVIFWVSQLVGWGLTRNGIVVPLVFDRDLQGAWPIEDTNLVCVLNPGELVSSIHESLITSMMEKSIT